MQQLKLLFFYCWNVRIITFNKKAFSYIYDNGIIEESAYPFYSGLTQVQVILKFKLLIYRYFYLNKQGKCKFANGKLNGNTYNGSIYYLSKFIRVDSGDDKALMEVLDKYGPVAVGIDASKYNFFCLLNRNFLIWCVSNRNRIKKLENELEFRVFKFFLKFSWFSDSVQPNRSRVKSLFPFEINWI